MIVYRTVPVSGGEFLKMMNAAYVMATTQLVQTVLESQMVMLKKIIVISVIQIHPMIVYRTVPVSGVESL
jgi:hypothetical protein